MAARKQKQQASGLFTVDDVIYDDATHTSSLRDGREVPHVTAVLSAVGISADFEDMAKYGPRVAEAIENARHLGDAVHKDTHAYDDDDLDLSAVHPVVMPYLEAWATFRANKRATPLIRERRLFHPLDFYTGIMDGVFLVDGEHVLVDIKTGDPEAAGCRWQTAAYEKAFQMAHPDIPIHRRIGVRLDPTRRVPYVIHDYTSQPDSWRDFATFQAFLVTYRHQAARRRKG